MAHGDGSIVERPTATGIIRYQVRWIELDSTGRQRRRSKTFADRDKASAFLASRASRRRSGKAVLSSELTVSQLVAECIDRVMNVLRERLVL